MKHEFVNKDGIGSLIMQYGEPSISKNYFQGRTDISFLIDAYNKKNLAEINLISSYGDFETKKIDYEILTLQ